MGIYSIHGLEYLVFTLSAEQVCHLKEAYGGTWYVDLNAVSLVGQDATDARLVATEYYRERIRDDTWGRDSYRNTIAAEIDAGKLAADFVATGPELEMIERLSADPKLAGARHGWCEVNHLHSTM